MKRIIHALLFISSAFLCSCSLLEFSLDGGASEPLSDKDLSARFAVRTFATDYISLTTMASDSISASTDSIPAQKNAIEWKLSVANTISPIAFQSVSTLALVSTWVYCAQMNDLMQTAFSDSLFGTEQAKYAKNVSSYGEQLIAAQAEGVLAKGDYRKVADFVEEYALNHPFTSLDVATLSLAEPYAEYMQIPDSALVQSVGSMPEVVSDISEKLGMYSMQMRHNLDWNKDMIQIYWENDSLANEILQRTDTLTALMYIMTDIANRSPELMQQMAANVNTQLSPLIVDMDSLMHNSVEQFSYQRDSLQQFVDSQRVELQEDLVNSGDSLMQSASDSLASFVKQITFVVVLGLILLLAILFGFPFFLGFYFAKLKYKLKERNDETNADVN